MGDLMQKARVRADLWWAGWWVVSSWRFRFTRITDTPYWTARVGPFYLRRLPF